MPRPKGKQNRKRMIRVRVTVAELEEIRKYADKAKLTVSAYLRRRALRFTVKSRYDEATINELKRVGGLIKKEALELPVERRGPYWAVLKLITTTIININKAAARELAWPKLMGNALRNIRDAVRELKEVASAASDDNRVALARVADRLTQTVAGVENSFASEAENTVLEREGDEVVS